MEAELSKGFLCNFPFCTQQALINVKCQTKMSDGQERKEETYKRFCRPMAKMNPDYRACPTPRMLFRSSLAFRVQVWLIARVAKNRMHLYKQESKCIIS